MNKAALIVSCVLWVSAHRPVMAHGVWAHIHVTGWAVENLAPGPVRDFFRSDPEILNAALFGAAFTDAGYAPLPGDPIRPAARAFGEHTHWEPFIEDFIDWIRVNDPPPWTSLESQKRVAFLLGCASHGLQDELFDSLFLYQVAEHDGGAQDGADPASDGFLAIDGHIRFLPTPWTPTDTLMELYASLDADITADVLEKSVGLMFDAYINETLGRAIIEGNGRSYADSLPWTKAHYLDTSIPGSLRSEIIPTGHYIEAIWKRLHGDLSQEDFITYAFPEAPRRLLSGLPDTPDSWVTIVYGIGVRDDSVKTRLVTQETRPREDDEERTPQEGQPSNGISHTLAGTRWGHSFPRLHRVQPLEALVPGGYHSVVIEPGVERIDGVTSTQLRRHDFQVACAQDNDPACPATTVTEPSIEGWVDYPSESATDEPPRTEADPEENEERPPPIQVDGTRELQQRAEQPSSACSVSGSRAGALPAPLWAPLLFFSLCLFLSRRRAVPKDISHLRH